MERFTSIFDIIGPVMVGPSSSHTAGAARIGGLARRILGEEPAHVVCTLYDSFAHTGRGHGTDIALVGGLLGLSSHDPQLVNAFTLAKEAALQVEWHLAQRSPTGHPNSVHLELTGRETGAKTNVLAVSQGGGKVAVVQIDGFFVTVTGQRHTLLIFHQDRFGAIARVTSTLAMGHCNIAYMEVARTARGREALMVIELDQAPSEDVLTDIASMPVVNRVSTCIPEVNGYE
ncbi:MAG TPA: L-serine ammonia-lyase, iron-sulfur-dependent, subunit beta [Firmicutes bacterium]|jgi:L-serine dehydratase|nr:L-serine ammonia-lyase, iron-sulfur-dependent, subunit beta [Bacillota bacterium]